MILEFISLIIAMFVITFFSTVVKITVKRIKFFFRERRYIKMKKKKEKFENQDVTKVQY